MSAGATPRCLLVACLVAPAPSSLPTCSTRVPQYSRAAVEEAGFPATSRANGYARNLRTAMAHDALIHCFAELTHAHDDARTSHHACTFTSDARVITVRCGTENRKIQAFIQSIHLSVASKLKSFSVTVVLLPLAR
jgi:hypothetical protein